MNTFRKNIWRIILVAFLVVAQDMPFPIFNSQMSMTGNQSSIVFAQAKTGTDANTTTKTSGTRDGTSKSTSIFPGFIKGVITDKSTNSRVAGASVALKQSIKTVARSSTASDGTFFFEVLPGNYNVVVNKSEFAENIVNAAISAFETVTKNIAISTSDGNGGGKTGVCVASTILDDRISLKGNIEESKFTKRKGLNILRHFRNSVLSKTLKGLSLIKLYYKHSPEVTTIIESDTDLRSRASGALNELVNIIQETNIEGQSSSFRVLLSGITKSSISVHLKNDINNLLDDIAQRGSDELKIGIKKARKLASW